MIFSNEILIHVQRALPAVQSQLTPKSILPRGKRPNQFTVSDCGKAHRRHATAPRAIRISAELARLNSRLKVCRQRMGSRRKNATIRRRRRSQKLVNHTFRILTSMLGAKSSQNLYHPSALVRSQAFGIIRAALGRENTHPDFFRPRDSLPRNRQTQGCIQYVLPSRW